MSLPNELRDDTQAGRIAELEAALAEAQALALANGMRADAAERRIAKAIDVLLNNDIARCVAEAVAVLRGE